ncbi:MAG: IS110 family transposase [Acidobacteria bacterium]|nr:IS110 family transposase [Acidobacteriota bacterium]
MEVLYPRCAGLDLGKDALVACVRIHGRPVRQECRTFGMTTRELLALAAWLTEHGVTHVAMEATGTYWKAVWYLLEDGFTLTLANAAHIRNVPGRKSDVKDAAWIADLLAHGLIRGSFVPPAPIQEVRDLTRTRKQLVREIAQHTQRIQKTLDTATLKITGLMSNIIGVSGRAILRALIAGQTDPVQLADLAHGTLKNKRAALVEALTGRLRPHQRRLLTLHLDLIERLEAAVTDLDTDLGEALAPFRDAVARVDAVPGIDTVVAQAILGEIGLDMARFPTHQHLISWACLCRRLDESAGKRKSTRTRKGACWLKTVLVQAAWAAVRTKNSYYRAQFLRLRARRGPKKAIVAVAASMLTAIYYILRDGVEYHELGGQYFERLDRTKATQRLVKRLRDLGYHVQLEEVAA